MKNHQHELLYFFFDKNHEVFFLSGVTLPFGILGEVSGSEAEGISSAQAKSLSESTKLFAGSAYDRVGDHLR